ncbi:MAG: hypothetical protein K0B02_05225 [DPANN group archaeon]|nr:hypothetical protein [DPANN group archaeon]
MDSNKPDQFISSKNEISNRYNDEITEIEWNHTGQSTLKQGLYKNNNTNEMYRCVELILPSNQNGYFNESVIPVFIGIKIQDTTKDLIDKFDQIFEILENHENVTYPETYFIDQYIGINKEIIEKLQNKIDFILDIQDALIPKITVDGEKLADIYVSSRFDGNELLDFSKDGQNT